MHGHRDLQQSADAPSPLARVTSAAPDRLHDDSVRRSPAQRLVPGLTDRTDAHLLRLARDGDPRAYEAIVARYREPLRRACERIAPGRAEDAVQQTLLSAWLALERGAVVRELRPWLYSIARNAAIDQARGVRSELVELGPEVAGGEDPAQAEARRREVSEVLEAVAALPERQRRALVDTALHGRATEAVAVDLGLSGGALRQLVHRARTNVRAAVPSIALPLPAWLLELLGEEGARRGVVLLGSGSGALVLAKATATVASVGALVIGGVQLDHAGNAPGAARGVERTVGASATQHAAARSGTAAELRTASIAAPGLLVTASLLPASQAGGAAQRRDDGAAASLLPAASGGDDRHIGARQPDRDPASVPASGDGGAMSQRSQRGPRTGAPHQPRFAAPVERDQAAHGEQVSAHAPHDDRQPAGTAVSATTGPSAAREQPPQPGRPAAPARSEEPVADLDAAEVPPRAQQRQPRPSGVSAPAIGQTSTTDESARDISGGPSS